MFSKVLWVTKWFYRGWNNYTKDGFETNSSKFSDLDKIVIPKLVVIVTGGSSGIGYATVKKLVEFQNMTVHLVCSNEQRGKKALTELNKNMHKSSNILLHIVDLTDIKLVKKFTDDFVSRNIRINVLVNNAGVLATEYSTIKNSDIEYSFGLNVLGTKVLTEGLLPIMDNPSFYNYPRVITVTSGGALTESLEYNDPTLKLIIKDSTNNFDGAKAYSQQKRQQIHLTEYWAEKYPQINFMSQHPGWVDTPGVQKSLPTFYKYMKTRLRTPQQGADTIVYLAIHPEVDENCGKGLLYFDRQPVEKFVSTSQLPTRNQIATFISNIEQIQQQF